MRYAVADVDRALFLPPDMQALAEVDDGIHIGGGIVVPSRSVTELMVRLLALKPTDSVFEVGLGSGYQAAVLAQLCAEVHSVDIRPFPESVSQLPENVYIRQADGRMGPNSPVDAILVSCGTDRIWPRWGQMLKEGGRLVAPVGTPERQAIRKYLKAGSKLLDGGDYGYSRFVQMEAGKP